MTQQKYLHGYTEKERQRLLDQNDFLELMIYKNIDFSKCTHVLEIGCGVGAHLKVLLTKYPQLKVTGIDIDAGQIAKAEENIKSFEGRYNLMVGDATHLKLDANDLPDGALFCWVLEHVSQPIEILKAVRANLQPGSPIYLTEVYNNGFYIHPSLPNIESYWKAYNRLQNEAGGDAVAGVKLGYHLSVSGYQNIEVQQICKLVDVRDTHARAEMANYLYNLLISGSDVLMESNLITQEIVDGLKEEFEILSTREDAIIFYPGFQASARS